MYGVRFFAIAECASPPLRSVHHTARCHTHKHWLRDFASVNDRSGQKLARNFSTGLHHQQQGVKKGVQAGGLDKAVSDRTWSRIPMKLLMPLVLLIHINLETLKVTLGRKDNHQGMRGTKIRLSLSITRVAFPPCLFLRDPEA